MTDKTDPQTISGFNRRNFITGAAGTAQAPLVAKSGRANPPAPQDASLPVNVSRDDELREVACKATCAEGHPS